MTTYVIHPGHVVSTTDGDLHYIGFRQLCGLYGVDAKCCRNAAKVPAHLLRDDRYVHLFPSHNGDYSLPAART